MYLDLGRWITGSALCLSGPLKRLASTFSGSLLQRQSTSQGNMRDSEPPEILYDSMRLVLVSFTTIAFIIIETLHDHLKSLRYSKPPVLGTPRTKGQES